MKFKEPKTIKAIASEYNAQIIGDESQMITGINEINKVELGDITFVDVEKYFQKSINSQASVVLINKVATCPPGKTLLLVDQPFEVYNDLVLKERPLLPLTAQISPSAVIHPSAIIEPGVVIGHHVSIGANSWIQANVYLGEYTQIGNDVCIQAGTLIGTDAFYYKKQDGKYIKWRSGGRVIIEDNVDIGAGCTINKGVSGDTIIGEGSKLDCQIHVGHGVVIGKNCLFASQVGIGGKTIIEDDVVLYGQVGLAQRLRIGKGVTVLAQSGVGKDLEAGKTYFGSPADEVKIKFRELTVLKQLAKK
ncbi:MAG: LpxD N-terminal domain-containing protein [Saprospiraceae bacterium]